MTTKAILARIMASRDPDALERAGGGPALASMVARVVSGNPSDGAKLLVGDEYAEVALFLGSLDLGFLRQCFMHQREDSQPRTLYHKP